MDMKKEFPAQKRGRQQWIIDAIKANQNTVHMILHGLLIGRFDLAKEALLQLDKLDRDAILHEDGILKTEQIERLTKKADQPSVTI